MKWVERMKVVQRKMNITYLSWFLWLGLAWERWRAKKEEE